MSKDYCPNCCVITNHTSLFKKATASTDNDFHWTRDYEVIQCTGCENIQFLESYNDEYMTVFDHEIEEEVFYNDKKYYPKNIKEHRDLKNSYSIPDKIRIVYNESLEALKNNCYLLSAVGLRAVIEAVCIEENIPGRNLETKINNLVRGKLITEKDAYRLHSIRFLGNDSVHDMDVPSEEKLKIALGIVENLVSNLYLVDLDAKRHLDTIVTDYEDFKNLFLRKFRMLGSGEEKSIKEVLKKDYRRIEPNYINNFVQQIAGEIVNASINGISIGTIKTSSLENSAVQHFIKN
jgi:hypothetical protein